MQYRKDKKGNEISLLGFGCMRFEGGGTGDYFQKANDQVMEAIHQGINYFDTAYVYKNNEKVLGRILSENKCRDQVYIATKLPQYMVRSIAQAEKIFNQELELLQTDHVDYYLMHMLNDLASWNRLKAMGIEDWIKEKMDSGKIRNIGFSYHGNTESFKPVADAYDWDFCQIQYNYMDENIQAGRKGLLYAAEKGLPVIIMEPLRGGRLVGMLPETAKKRIEKSDVNESAASLALRWLYDQPQVTCVLSGMNSMEMVRENIKTASDAVPGCLTDAERQLIENVKNDIKNSVKMGCTGCNYCCPCPKGVDIPAVFQCYNQLSEDSHARWRYIQITAFRKETTNAAKCVGCGACAKKCPQHLDIPRLLKEAQKELETPMFKIINWGTHFFHFY